MERRGQAAAPGSGGGPARRSPGSRRGCEGEAGAAAAAAAAGAVVQRTQVVLLAGEPWGLDGGQTVLNSFAHHVLPVAPAPPGQEGEPRRAGASAPPPTPSSSFSPSSPGPGALPSEAAAGAAGPSGRLIFFLCRAGSLRDREARLREVLRGVREQSRGAPAVLVGVVVQPRPEEEQGALGHLERLMRDAVQEEEEEEGAPVEVHTAVFAPGRPGGALELRRLANSHLGPLPAASTLWPDKSRAMQILGAAVSFGTLVYGGYYVCNNLLM
ncbi:hypothetical protein JRQ81_008234 [Phrynocephalus forsythii]|uniref:Uncharacterized protein n=1 Tax=Phrynocephalus forsythii TaxID=171643 RepID=A0A9Q0XCE0_9SAUR|nr:hypothetical protein JRQ81_008234 [Phrynocephalus forsythii]